MKKALSLCGAMAVTLSGVSAQTSYTDVGATGAWNTSRWNNTADTSPYTSTFTANNNVIFSAGNYSFAGMGSTTNVGNISVLSGANVNFASIGSTFATGGNVRTIDVAADSVIDFQSQAFSTASGTGFVKSGNGVLALAGGGYNGGFTLNAGTVIARGVDAFGAGATNVLTLNGGTVASNANRSFTTAKHGGGIVIGGNVQFGELSTVVTIASSSANLSFANNVSLGAANRTLTLGNNGNHAFSGIISNVSGGITFAANSGADGRFDITNAANTFTGDINIVGGEVRFTSDGSMGNTDNDIIIDGGRFATGSGATFTLDAGRSVFVGDGAGTSISTPGAGTFTINSGIADKTGEIGSWAKQGGGTLELGGVSTYSGNTTVSNGVLKLVSGNNRLPTGTVVSIGQMASSNVGTLDLNGNDQEIAGLQSISGDNVSANKNTVTSLTAATLTINTLANYSYGDATTQNSGIITGDLNIVKNGSGTQTLGGINTYTGSTLVNEGVLIINGELSGTSGTTVASGAAIGGSGIITNGLTLDAGANFVFSITNTLVVNSGVVSFGGFGIENLLGLDSSIDAGTYTLIDGLAAINFANVANLGLANAFDLGGGKSAYFQEGSLQVVVVPEPSAWVMLSVGLMILAWRKKRRVIA